MDTPALQALMQSAAEEQPEQPHQPPDALQAAAAAQLASGLDSLQAVAGQAFPGLPAFPGLVGWNPAQAAVMGHVGQAAAAMHMLGASAGSNGRRPGTYAYRPSKGGPLVCQVEGCGVALDNLREYHQRYRVCEEHLKTPYVVKDGQQLRFCQQCGRFQPLTDFDGEKRSCRVRLQRHNARRRKRQRDSEGGGSTDLAAYDAAVSAAAAVEMAKLAGYGQPPMPISAQEMQAMQDALQFASATLMHAGQAPPKAAREEGGSEGGDAPQAGSEGAGEGGGEGDLGGGALAANSMPFVPTVDVMMLLLKGYAAMFHYVLEGATIRPLAPPSELPDQQAVATAGLGGMDPQQMTQLMQAQGFLPATMPFSLPGSEVAPALLAGGDGAEAAADDEQQQQQQDAESGGEEAAAAQQTDSGQGGGNAGGAAAPQDAGDALTAQQVAAAVDHAALAAALAQHAAEQAAGAHLEGHETGSDGDDGA